MIGSKNLNIEIDNLDNLKLLLETYQTIASTIMRRIRSSVLQNRAFHEGLNQIFQEVKLAYKNEVMQLMKKRKIYGRKLSLVRRNGKTVFVLLSANTGLYGDIIGKTAEYFVIEIKKQKCDVMIIGNTGKSVFEKMAPETPFAYEEFPDDRIEVGALKKITEQLNKYEKVVVFHGVFRNFFIQDVSSSNVSGELLAEVSEAGMKYRFEPSLENIMVFFETEIFASLLEQTFQESRLAKLASRMKLLDKATQNIDLRLKSAAFFKKQLRHRYVNRKQLDALSGVSLW